MGGHTSPALTGPPEAGGRLIGGAGAVAPAGRPKADLLRGGILSKSVVARQKFAKMVPSPRPYRSGLVVRPPAWDPRGARFDSWCLCVCVFKPWCFWGGAKAFSAAKIDLSQNQIGVPWIFVLSLFENCL